MAEEKKTAAKKPAAKPAAKAAKPKTPKAPKEIKEVSRGYRKARRGYVVSDKMDKTAVVETIDRVRHRRYAKTVQRNKKLHVHDEENTLNIGDRVRVQETRPLSKNKRWRLVEILERAK